MIQTSKKKEAKSRTISLLVSICYGGYLFWYIQEWNLELFE
eukprot:SAG11_NODE_109_length_16381_cov_48.316546_13_plen_41_part_00